MSKIARGAVTALQALTFDGCGPGFAVFLGFVAGVSIAADLERTTPALAHAAWCRGRDRVRTGFPHITDLHGWLFHPSGRFVSIPWVTGISLKLPFIAAYKWSVLQHKTSMQATEA